MDQIEAIMLEALDQLAPWERVRTKLGRFFGKPHRIWDWRLSVGGSKLIRCKGLKIDVYVRIDLLTLPERKND